MTSTADSTTANIAIADGVWALSLINVLMAIEDILCFWQEKALLFVL